MSYTPEQISFIQIKMSYFMPQCNKMVDFIGKIC